jgi:hypothetical protein
LQPGGLLVIAIPVITATTHTHNQLTMLLKLGILSMTWSSEHYELEHVKSTIIKNGFGIDDIRRIGHYVYEPLADYYISNRDILRCKILKKYSSLLENVLYKSLLKMHEISRKGIIDYIIIKASR